MHRWRGRRFVPDRAYGESRRRETRENSSVIHSIRGVAPDVNSRRKYNRWRFAEDGWRYIFDVAVGQGLCSEWCLM